MYVLLVLLLLFLLGSAVLHTLHTSTTTYFEIQTKSFFIPQWFLKKIKILCGRHRMTEKYLKFSLFFLTDTDIKSSEILNNTYDFEFSNSGFL